MGDLFDAGKLTRSDLDWGLRKAYNVNVRRACLAFLDHLDRHAKPVEYSEAVGAQVEAIADAPRYGPRVITGGEYLEEQEAMHWGYVAFLVGMGLFAAIVVMATAVQVIVRQTWGIGIVVAVIYAILFTVLWRRIKQAGKEYRRYRDGRKGEQAITEQIRTSLDHRWTVFRNLRLPKRRADLDMVLLGPGGIWVVEVKAFNVAMRVNAGVWEYQQQGRWVPVEDKRNPARQAKGNAMALRQFLDEQNIQIPWVEPAIALSEPQPVSNFTTSDVPVWLPSTVAGHVSRLTARVLPSSEDTDRTNAVLERLADHQRVRESAPKDKR